MNLKKSVAAVAALGLVFAVANDATAATRTTKKKAKATTKAKTTKPAPTTTAAPTTTKAAGKTLLGGRIKCENQHKGKTVTIYSPNDDAKDAAGFEVAWKELEECTGVDAKWLGDKGFEKDVNTRLQAGNAPDVLDFPQPGGLQSAVKTGKLVALPDDIKNDVATNFLGGWDDLGTVDGKFYGAAFQSNFKSFVWYNPQAFKAKGYTTPKTLDELKALSDKIVADGGTPWCVGIESGDATGWVVTDWMEDFMLRTATPKDYDDWYNHRIPFNDPKVKAAADLAASFIKNDKYVDNVKAIATTRFQDGGLPIESGKCFMHRQASFYKSFWKEGTVFGENGTMNVFYLPMKTATEKKAMLGGGDLNAATNNKPETMDVIRYLSSKNFADGATVLGKLSPRKDYDTSKLSPIDQVIANIGKNADIFRFDASDLMPKAANAAFWKEGTNWITGKSTSDFLDAVEKEWPKA